MMQDCLIIRFHIFSFVDSELVVGNTRPILIPAL